MTPKRHDDRRRRVRPVVVVSHEATRTGAPRVALEVVAALRADGHQVVALLRAGGPMAAEFAAVSDRVVREPLPRIRTVLRRLRATRAVANRLETAVARLMLARLRPSSVYLNTVKSASYVKPAARRGVPTVLHVHELEPMASSVLGRYGIRDDLRRVRLVACGWAVRDNLTRIAGVPADSVTVVPSSVDVARIERLAAEPPAVSGFDDAAALVVGACGTANPGKGVDQWLELVTAVRAARPGLAVRFVWVGGVDDGPRARARELDVEDVVTFAGETASPYAPMARMAVFTLPSRSDANPLVVVEAMTLARPVVAFDVGDVARQLAGHGVVVPAGDVHAMADAVVELLDDAPRRQRIGQDAAAWARAHYGIDRLRVAVRGLVDAGPGVPGQRPDGLAPPTP